MFLSGCRPRGKTVSLASQAYLLHIIYLRQNGVNAKKYTKQKTQQHIVAPLTSSGLGLRGVILMSDSVTDSTTGATLLRTGRPARVMYTLCSVGTKNTARDRQAPKRGGGRGGDVFEKDGARRDEQAAAVYPR